MRSRERVAEDTAVPCPYGRSRNKGNSIAHLYRFLGREKALPIGVSNQVKCITSLLSDD
ncbi:hypothetical protein [Microcoleus sp. herbarium12]|uniref:hypothetical protein n=1 Tax=Microcoleus sp. herbarium12 TaxID=3055437 RepID=UPI002FD04263